MKKIGGLALLLICHSLVWCQSVYKKKCLLMGVDFEFAVVAKDATEAERYLTMAVEETQRIEKIISSWDANSQTSLINKNAGIQPVPVSVLLYGLIERSKRISELTRGYFDISFASIDQFWDFNKIYEQLPDSSLVAQSVEKINYKNIILNPSNHSVFLKEKGMKIGFGAIGKGFVAEHIRQMWQQQGVTAGLINASGDLTCFGEHPQHKKWKIALRNPNKPTEEMAWFDLDNSSVVTSGGYEKFITINGERYAHIINPKTGWPAKGLKSVSVFCSNAELADALATAVFVMGVQKGLNFINQLKGVEALLIDDNNQQYKTKSLTIQEF